MAEELGKIEKPAVEQFKQGRKLFFVPLIFSPPETETYSDEEQAVRWAEDLENKGVERVNFVTGGGNDNLAKVVRMRQDKFSGFAHHDLFSEDAPSELERAVKKLGLRGYKVIASSQVQPIDDEDPLAALRGLQLGGAGQRGATPAGREDDPARGGADHDDGATASLLPSPGDLPLVGRSLLR